MPSRRIFTPARLVQVLSRLLLFYVYLLRSLSQSPLALGSRIYWQTTAVIVRTARFSSLPFVWHLRRVVEQLNCCWRKQTGFVSAWICHLWLLVACRVRNVGSDAGGTAVFLCKWITLHFLLKMQLHSKGAIKMRIKFLVRVVNNR